MTSVVERLVRSAKLAETGCNTELYLDQLAVEAFVRMYPLEAPSGYELVERKPWVAEHVYDAFVGTWLELTVEEMEQ